ncbi:MAG TPA: tetratricopeptide repeat protein [Candidatus Binatia bacterium]
MSERASLRVAALTVFAAGLLIYVNTLWNGFPFDDAIQVEQNLYVRSLAHLPAVFSQSTWPGYVYRPLPTLTYALTWALVGPEPWLYHLTSALLHAGVSVLVLLLLARFFARPVALLGALLFALHPIHVEAVASVANRTELLAALLGIGAALLVVPRTERADGRLPVARLVLGAAALFAALLAKESALTIAVAVPLLVAARAEVAGASGVALGERWRRVARGSAAPLAALAVGALCFFVVRHAVLGGDVLSRAVIAPIDNPLIARDAPSRVAHALALLGRYLAMCVFPWRLSADYSFGTPGLFDGVGAPAPLLWLALCAALAVATVVGIARGSLRLAFVGLWFFGTFAITSNVLLPIGAGFAERLAYVPSVAVCALVAWLLVEHAGRVVRIGGSVALLAAYAVLTLSYNRVWHDDATLLAYEMRTSPSAKVQAAYGKVLLDRGAHDEARALFHAALDAYPRHMMAAYGLGLVELKEGRPDAARVWLEKAIELDPGHPPSLVLLGRMRFADGEIDEAARLFVRALNSDNKSFDAKLGILAALLARDNLAQAAPLRDELMALSPRHAELLALSAELDRRLAGAGGRSGAGGDDARRTVALAGSGGA